ncbi:MAG: hypothetical protein BWZ01_01455 [Deltaproteobacteria bacterium ADurb.BinA179]|jgi:uncharacterized protein (TIGR02231 family)|nr:mucoidy inhibitor MuiA family protein [Deltaproteobacteria bacterium]MDI9542450.1 mucoidy inhibitor MuiA family protein [Pseudomonadota bacterium]OPZ27834.1 MAG: hypothetical protein BWZ01_01455 [Deltaproteobacteria bacterium ADurb.BinA179]HOD69516.1 mucoidy inhibitor MuiA family protein [Deltaproteobacteria bacterium]HOE71375.1 mucoidy inhibitor MuiA family protein [Deltaproteobacteria bacterium]
MKKILSVILVTVVLAGAAHAQSFKRVVLYQDMALLTVEVSASGGRIAVDCPPELILDSVVVAPVRGTGVRSMSIEPKRLASGKAKELRDALGAKRVELEERKRRQKTVERQIELIFDAAGVKDKETPFSRTRLSDALMFIDEKVEELNKKHILLGGEIEDLSLAVKDLEERLEAVSRERGYEIAVETDGDGTVEISYAVKSGSWKPEYAVYAAPGKNEVRIDATAVVRQATGADWEAEELLVATGRPGFGIHAPELSPWYIGLPRYRLSVMKQKADMTAAAPEEYASAQDFEAGVRATAASYVIGAAESITLPGDGTPKSIIIQRKTIEATIERLTCPRIDSAVFLKTQALWSGSAPIIAGTYSAYVDGEFTGRGTIGEAQPGEMIGIDLGRDEGIKVEREGKMFHEKTLTGKDRTTYTYTMTVKNTRSHPVQITLKDQIPVSQDEAVRVELVESSPKAVPDKDGIMVWELSCTPGAVRTVSFAFAVTGLPPLER